jgi:hypothetical protein
MSSEGRPLAAEGARPIPAAIGVPGLCLPQFPALWGLAHPELLRTMTI